MSTLGSLFDGSGGFPLAGALSGITPLWASEIEPYPIAVTTSRFPQMKHLGNVAEVDGRKIPPVDIITFGSPCQDMSVAGKRAGMKHREKGDDATTRSGLFYEAIRIIREMREATNGRYPTFAIWENVPGAFSSNGGEDFRCVLEELAKICGGCTIPRPANGKWRHAGEIVGDGYSIAWRLLDAQYWGVPQRRKRIYLVADFAGGRAGKILFERESVRGDSAQGGEARKGVARGAAEGTGKTGTSEGGAIAPTRASVPQDKPPVPAPRLQASWQAICLNDQGGSRMDVTHEMTCTLWAKANHPPCVMGASGFCTEHSADSWGIGYGKEESPPLMVRDYKDPPVVGRDEPAYALDRACFSAGENAQYSMNVGEEKAPTLVEAGPCAVAAPAAYLVRRLTPGECCRLQGFPDGWGVPKHKDAMDDCEAAYWEDVRRTYAEIAGKTYKPFATRAALVKWYNGLHTDSAEYKMWGNAVALPCAYNVVSGCAEELRRIFHADAG